MRSCFCVSVSFPIFYGENELLKLNKARIVTMIVFLIVTSFIDNERLERGNYLAA